MQALTFVKKNKTIIVKVFHGTKCSQKKGKEMYFDQF